MRCGWCWSMEATMARNGQRSARLRRRSAARRRCSGSGFGRPSATGATARPDERRSRLPIAPPHRFAMPTLSASLACFGQQADRSSCQSRSPPRTVAAHLVLPPAVDLVTTRARPTRKIGTPPVLLHRNRLASRGCDDHLSPPSPPRVRPVRDDPMSREDLEQKPPLSPPSLEHHIYPVVGCLI